MADVETRRTIVLPSPGDVVYLEGWGGVLGICKEYDRNKPNEITLTWPPGYWDLFWTSPDQRFTSCEKIEITVMRSPAQFLGYMCRLISRRDEQIREHMAGAIDSILNRPMQQS
jgi:hypothetical protein